MKNFLLTTLIGCLLFCSNLAAAQKLADAPVRPCGTVGPTKEYLAAHPEVKARMEALEAQTQRFIRQASATALKEAPGTPIKPSIIIPVVVHLLYYPSSNPRVDVPNLSDAVVQEQIESLNADFRKLNADVTRVPAAFAPLVGNARVAFCLATRDPNGNATTGITRRRAPFDMFFWNDGGRMKSNAAGGTDAWNTEQYLNIWCCRLDSTDGVIGFSNYPGTVLRNMDGVVVDTRSFGKGPHLEFPNRYTLGRTLTHEVGHWLDLKHTWGDASNPNFGCDDDGVPDTPRQQIGGNFGKPVFPRISSRCNNGPNGDMFMNYMDYTDDDAKFMFSADQTIRMQAVLAPTGYYGGLATSPGLLPVLSIGSLGTVPNTLLCGDRTDYQFRVNPVAVGCMGGILRYYWTAPGWTVTNEFQIYPKIIPSNSGTTITLTGTYTDYNGVVTQLNTATRTIGYLAVPPTPAFTSGPAILCSGQAATFSVTPVAGATGYRWTVQAGFTAAGQVITNGQTTTTAPSLTITPDAGLAGGSYSVQCQALAGSGCPPSAVAYRSFDANGGMPFMIVDVDGNPAQSFGGLVCQQNYIKLKLVPVSSGTNATATGVTWRIGNWTSASDANYPLQLTYPTVPAGGVRFTMTAMYTNNCGNRVPAVDYSATTANSNIVTLGNGYSCIPNRYRSVPPVPYPNPATATLQLPGYRGQLVVYNQQGKPVQTLLAPGTDYGATLDISSWPEGLYVVTGQGLNGEFVRHNVQIQH